MTRAAWEEAWGRARLAWKADAFLSRRMSPRMDGRPSPNVDALRQDGPAGLVAVRCLEARLHFDVWPRIDKALWRAWVFAGRQGTWRGFLADPLARATALANLAAHRRREAWADPRAARPSRRR